MDTTAFALRAEFDGTETIEGEDGPVEVPKYQGGLLFVGDGDFNVGEQLDAGAGTIVVYSHDQRLVDLLRAYAPLKEVPVPADHAVVNPYGRQTVEELRQLASLRGIQGAGNGSKVAIAAALLAYDRAIRTGDQDAVSEISVSDPGDGLDKLTKQQLADLFATHDIVVPETAKTNADLVSALREAGISATEEA